ncbi:glycosyltransferase family 4 protein [Bradyrhizobium sp. BWA-3-5]|uniref:MraY family glycosyltransferase n=1 Tax=Bradyrhizobium sp. BWA-3-5 TaxID=3080013 RepID=UPI00293E9A05|nr:glycosyltransferase family 4 protein [Bradyrhizobium sp. BWA-3-5]WOH68247.1 glycosyltransferase family 4 protein [Bradyrhizobium sp. BWA-3-5]
MANSQPLLSLAAAVPAALLSGVLTWALRPLLLRIALAKPNARSSHRVPTPQGAGIAVIAATLVAAAAVIAFAGAVEMRIPLAVFGATLFIAAVGFADDIYSIPVVPRLSLQGAAVAAVILAAPDNLRLVAGCPFWLERGLLFLAGLWFVNLVNFMDGLDLMTVAEIVPVTGALVLLGWLSELPASTTVVAAALFGAMLGFAPFNKPVARIFLGDVGSLPIGLLVGWCLLQLVWHHQVTAALLLPLYYLADATVTLLRRVARREPFWEGHRSHFYQRATENGFSVSRVVSEVFALNVLLAALATGSVMTSSTPIAVLLFVIGAAATAFLLHRFSRVRPSLG